MPKRLGTAASGFLLFAVIFTISGCSMQAAGRPRSPNSAATPYATVVDSVDLRLPVQDYMSNEQQRNITSAAWDRLLDRCLQRFNVRIAKTPTPANADAIGPRSLTDRRYGVYDLALAAKFGFGLGPRDPSLHAKPAHPDLGPDGETALAGDGKSQINGKNVPEGGCVSESERALNMHNPAGADILLPQKLQFQSFEWSKHDPRVLSAFKAWSTCMAAHQYRYPDPLAPFYDARFAGPVASKLEINTAVTDIGCKRKTNLVAIWFGVESEFQRQQINAHARAFKAAKDALNARVATAQKTLS